MPIIRAISWLVYQVDDVILFLMFINWLMIIGEFFILLLALNFEIAWQPNIMNAQAKE